MLSRLVLRALAAACLFTLALPAAATVTFYGTGGVYNNIFNGNSQEACTDCHAGGTPQSGRGYDTYAKATALVNTAGYGNVYNDAVAWTRINADQMPPTGVPMTDGEKTLYNTWRSQRVGSTAPPDTAAPTVSVDSGNVSSSQYSVTFAGKGNGGGLSTTYYFDYGTTAGYGTSTTTVTPSDTGGGLTESATYTRTLTGRACGTTYFFRPAAQNNGKGSATGSGSSVATSACPTVTTVSDVSTTEDSNISFTVTSANKGGSTTVSYALDATSLSRGMTINSSSGAFSWTAASTPDAPASNTIYPVTVTATYVTSGSPNSTDSDSFNITITPVNDAPVISSTTTGHTTATEGAAYSFDVDASDSEGNTLGWSLVGADVPAGMSINSSSGLISWTPAQALSNYSHSFTIRVTDNGSPNQSADLPITINVSADNDGPGITSSSATHLTGTEGVAYSYDVDATDPESQTLSYSLSVAPAGMTINASSGLISWTPAQALSSYNSSVTVQVSDGTTTASQSFVVTVSADNDAPSFSSSAITTAAEQVTYTYDVNATDPETQTLSYSLTTSPAGMSIDSSTGVISWVPPQAGSNYTENVTVRVTDGTNPVTQSFTITVSSSNDPPSFSSTDVIAATEDVAYSYDVNATDPESGSLSYSLPVKPSGMTIDSSTGVISWTPPQALSNYTASVTVQVTDGANPVQHSFVINVASDNDAPSITSTALTTLTEDTAYSYDVNASDLEGQTLSYSLTTMPSGMTINSSSGVISWTPPLNSNASANVVVSVSDGTNAVTQSFTIAITPVNDAPTFTSTAVTTLTEDAAYSYDVNATDVDGDTLSYTLTAKPSGMTINSSTGVIAWTPPLNSNASANVTVQVQDNGTGLLTATQSFTITITPVNDAPLIGNITDGSITELETQDLQVNVTDVDDANNGTALTWTLPTSHPTWVTISSTGLLHIAPPQDSDGAYTITVRVADGGENSAAASSDSFVLTVIRQDADSDTIADYHDNCPNTANTDQANNDGDSQGDLCDSDDDNDGIPDLVEVNNGLDPFVNDAAGDINHNGKTNLEDYQACGSDVGCYSLSNPVITTNGDIEMVATGYYTPVTISASAQGVSGPLTVTADKASPFRPGENVVTWSAAWTSADHQAQTATTTQIVKVKPLATLGGTEIVGINRTVYVPVRLNGDAPSYPVTVTYDVSGTAVAGTDYTALPGSLTFTSGSPVLESISVVISSGVSTDKTLIIKLTGITGDAALGNSLQHTLAITTQSSPPQLAFRVSQAGEIRQVVYGDDGDITVEALVDDPNGGPANCEDWQTGTLPVVINGCSVTIDASAASAGSFTLSTTAVDVQNRVTRSVTLLLLNNKPVLTADDTDGDGIANNVEGAVDSNHNGILDYLEAQGGEQPESILLRLGSGSSLLLLASADDGLQLSAGSYAIAAQSATTPQAGIQIFAAQVADGSSVIVDSDFAAVGAIYDFEVSGLSTVNTVAHVVLPLPVALPASAQWRELSSTGRWTSFSSVGGDAIASAPRGADGQCPAPGAAAYQAGLVAGNSCVQLTITDGGANDADGLVNGAVSVTAAPTVARAVSAAEAPTESQNGGAADIYTLVLLALAMMMLRRKELQR